MTIETLIELLSEKKDYVLIYLSFILLASIVLRLLHGRYRGKRSPWKYIYSVLIYCTCIPGVFSLTILIYSLLFLHSNLLTLDIYVCYLPVVFMIFTLAVIRKSVAFGDIPGFSKIYGLMLLIGITFLLVMILDRLRVFVFFGGSIASLLIICVVIFILLKYGIRLLFGTSKKRNRY